MNVKYMCRNCKKCGQKHKDDKSGYRRLLDIAIGLHSVIIQKEVIYDKKIPTLPSKLLELGQPSINLLLKRLVQILAVKDKPDYNGCPDQRSNGVER